MWITAAGAALLILNAYSVSEDPDNKGSGLGLAGGLGIVIGGIISIDSHKYLNVSKIPKKKL